MRPIPLIAGILTQRISEQIMITQTKLKEILHYSHATGIFTWLVKPNKRTCIGDIAGNHQPIVGGKYRIRIRFQGVTYRAHRLAWLYMTGIWPNNEIDHIDGDSINNSFSNLRDVDKHNNIQNQTKANKRNILGILGVSKVKTGYAAQIKIPNGKSKNLGIFETSELAHSAYLEAKRKYHISCTI